MNESWINVDFYVLYELLRFIFVFLTTLWEWKEEKYPEEEKKYIHISEKRNNLFENQGILSKWNFRRSIKWKVKF